MAQTEQKQRINIGCGASPTPGWLNMDGSLTVWLAKHPILLGFLRVCRLVGSSQLAFARYIEVNKLDMIFANATKRIPLKDGTATAVYSSHMLEHLDTIEVSRFLNEVYRVLAVGGTLRIAVPDLLKHARRYTEESRDADAFVTSTLLAPGKPRGLAGRLIYLAVGNRQYHLWMYDASSLKRRLRSVGFRDVLEISAGCTTIPDPGQLNLREREQESVYVEAKR